MPTTFSRTARYFAALIAVAVFASLAVQITINVTPDTSALLAFGRMMRFFTIWTNLAAGLTFGWIAWRGDADRRVLFSLATAIVIVGVVYHLLLSAEHHPVGWDWYTNQMFHTLIPIATVAWWLIYSRLALLTWQSLPVVMLVPVLYTLFALINGALTGFYPYFFLDLPKLGWFQLAIANVGLSVLFLAVAAVLLGLRKLIALASKA